MTLQFVAFFGLCSDSRSPNDQNITVLLDFDGTLNSYIALDELLSRTEAGQLAQYLSIARRLTNSFLRSKLEEQLLLRLTSIDPEHALQLTDTYKKEKRLLMQEVVFREWAIVDSDHLVKHVKKFDFATKCMAFRTLRWVHSDLSDGRIKEIVEEFEIKAFIDVYGTDTPVSNSISEDWNYIWKMILHDEKSNISQEMLLRDVAKSWWRQDGVEVVYRIVGEELDWNTKHNILRNIFHDLVQISPRTAFELSHSIESSMGNSLMYYVIESWADVKPLDALNAVESNQSEQNSAGLIETIISRWSTSAPIMVLKNIEKFAEPIQDYAKEQALRQLLLNSPVAAAKQLRVLKNSIKQTVANEIAIHWAHTEIDDVIDWAFNDPDIKDVRMEVLKTTLRELTKTNSNRAFKLARDYGIDSSGTGLEAVVIAELSQRDVRLALSLLPDVRDGVTQLRAYTHVGLALVLESPDEALTLARYLPIDAQALYRDQVVRHWVTKNPEQAFEYLNNIVSAAVSSRIAFEILKRNLQEDKLDASQTKYLTGFLNEVDKKSLSEFKNR